jgi:hypothetical protein
MDLLAKLEKTKILWWVIALCMLFFFLRLPSIIEPYWYGDEGIYEVVGQSMDQGRLLYRDIWDNKPPLLYVVYALAGGDQPTIKTFSIIAGLLSVIAFFLLSQKLFKKQRISLITTTIYVLLLATPILEGNIANAEDFILFPTILAGLLIYKVLNKDASTPKQYSIFNLQSSIFIAGLLLGIAFLFKIVAVFDLAAFFEFFIMMNLPPNITWKSFATALSHARQKNHQDPWLRSFLTTSWVLLLGFLLPLFLTIIYFTLNHAFVAFFQAVFSGNVSYVGSQNNLWGIPQGLLIIKCLLLIGAMYSVFKKRNRFTKPTLFILLWLIFSLFNAYFSERPYTHYVIVLLPSFCLFIGLLFASQKTIYRLKIFVGIIVVLLVLLFQFQFNIPKSFSYYGNAIQFLQGKKSVEEYQSFFDPKVPRDYAVASFIEKTTTPTDNVFIWGNNPQIYALAHKLPPEKYTVAYHITQNNAFEQTQGAIDTVKPKYIIALKEIQPLPFQLPLYIMQYNLPGAIIYERSF